MKKFMVLLILFSTIPLTLADTTFFDNEVDEHWYMFGFPPVSRGAGGGPPPIPGTIIPVNDTNITALNWSNIPESQIMSFGIGNLKLDKNVLALLALPLISIIGYYFIQKKDEDDENNQNG